MEIHRLPSDVIDKIAAGEVVDRPAHLVKELVENSLDAGATNISIEVSEGGRQVMVEDNGRGIDVEDLPEVFSRHATSKINVADDLWKLNTYGFRGEAIASISAVSQMEFVSHRQGANQGYRISSDCGRVSPIEPTACEVGTRVSVRELFDNIPARKKFLKSDSAEVTQIKNVIKAMAMCRPDVQFKLKVAGKLLFLWKKAESFAERVSQVLEIKKIYKAEGQHQEFEVEIAFSDPGTTARVSRQIWLFVQDRWVQDKTLQAAVMEAYRSLLMHGEYPYCVVRLKVPPDQVDVNVHPTKSQVKFLQQKEAFRAVHHCLRQALEKAPWLGSVAPATSPARPAQSPPANLTENLTFEQSSFQSTQFKQKSTSLPGPVESPGVSIAELQQAREVGGPNPPLEDFQEVHNEPTWSKLQVVGQVDLTYIVAQSEGSMVLVDQHAAHERVAFERLMASWKKGNIERQQFLLALHFDCEEAEVEGLLQYQTELKDMGIDIEQAGPTTISVESAPAIIREKGIVAALKKMAAEILDKGGSFAFETAVADIFATMACHSVIRAGQALSREEMEQLLRDMDEFPLSSFCPHGRSVSVETTFAQLEKDFGRRG